MVDTVVISGYLPSFSLPVSYETFRSFGRAGERERMTFAQVYSSDHFRAHYFPSTNRMRCEFSFPYCLFSLNSYNYASSVDDVYFTLRAIADTLFPCSDSFFSRVDLSYCFLFDTPDAALDFIALLKRAKPARVRASSWTKGYPTSVFFSTRGWSVKFYVKGYEQKSPKGSDLYRVVRYEKTYRAMELQRITGLRKRPFFGIPSMPLVSAFGGVIDDFLNVFEGWTFSAAPPDTSQYRGSHKLLAYLDALGQLTPDAVASVSRSSYYRYKKKKTELGALKCAAGDVYLPRIEFPGFTRQDILHRFQFFKKIPSLWLLVE
jgi:hypothetical protein